MPIRAEPANSPSDFDLDARIATQLQGLLSASTFRPSAAAEHRAELCHALLDRRRLKESSRVVRDQRRLLARDFNYAMALDLGEPILQVPDATPERLRGSFVGP